MIDSEPSRVLLAMTKGIEASPMLNEEMTMAALKINFFTPPLSCYTL